MAVSERFRERRALDEDFWQEQEAQLRGNLGQPCCTLSGMLTLLAGLSGNFAVVLHGEHECAASFFHQGSNLHRFYSVGLDDDDFASGETRDKLRECLTLVAEETSPEVVFVLGTCPVEVIGDRFETTVQEVEQHTGVPMRALHTSGLDLGSQAAMLDWLFETLASIPPSRRMEIRWCDANTLRVDAGRRRREDERPTQAGWSRRDRRWIEGGPKSDGARWPVRSTRSRLRGANPGRWDGGRAASSRSNLLPPTPIRGRSLNLIGLPRLPRGSAPEWFDVFAEAGLAVVGYVPHEAHLDMWRSLSYPKHSFVADKRLYPRLIQVLEGFGQRVTEVPLPVGVKQSEGLYQAVGEPFGLHGKIERITAKRRAHAEEQLHRFRTRFGRLRVAMGIRMLNNYSADQLAYEGLGDVEPLREMGFDLTLLVQGPPEEHLRQSFVRVFEELGCDLPFEVFPEPWGIAKRLESGGYQVAYLADHCREEARKAQVPMIVSRELQPYYEGVESNLIRIGKMLERVLGI